jgi:putative ABC transport system substrate-binding protein
VAYLINPDNPGSTGATLSTLESAAQHLNLELQQFAVRGPNEFESAFARMEQGRIQAVEVDDDAIFTDNIEAVAGLAAKRRLLSIGGTGFAQAGGLIGYGADTFARFRRAAAFVDKILKGTKPADLPIEQATNFQLVVNLKTAKALGVTIPETLLATADEVIQ